MTQRFERFEHLLLAHGADLERWPAVERAAARALLDESAAARALHDQMLRLDAALGEAVRAEPVGSALTGRVLAHVRAREGSGFAGFTRGWRVAFGTVAAAAIVLGFFTGLAVDGTSLLGLDPAGDIVVFVDQPVDVAELL